MSKAQQKTEQHQANQDAEQQEDNEPRYTHGLPDFLFDRVRALGPYQEAELVQLLRQFPPYREQLCSAAAANMSGRTIRLAAEMAIAKDRTDAAAGPVDPTQDMYEQIWAQKFDLQLEITRLTASDTDITKLATILRQQPHYRTQILRTARPNMGDVAVNEAVAEAHQLDVDRERKREQAAAQRKQAEAAKSPAEKEADAKKAQEQEAQWAATDRAESVQYKKDREATEWLRAHHPDTLNQLDLMGQDVENVAYMLGFNDDATKENIRHVVEVRYGASFLSKVDAKVQANHHISTPIDIAAARKYNAAHHDLVQSFLTAVRDTGYVGESGEINPIKVATFQSMRGIGVDGKVGPHTIAEAKEYAAGHIVGLE